MLKLKLRIPYRVGTQRRKINSLIPLFEFWNWNWGFHIDLVFIEERCSINQDLNDENLINECWVNNKVGKNNFRGAGENFKNNYVGGWSLLDT